MTPRASESFRGGVLWNVASLGVLALAGIGMTVAIARYAGPAALGTFNLAYALYIFASQLAVGGVQFSVLRYVSYVPEDTRECAEISSSALALSALSSSLVALFVVLVRAPVAEFFGSPDMDTALLAVAPGLVCFSCNKVLLGVLNGVRRMKAFALFQSLRSALILLAVIALLLLPISRAWLAGAFTIAEGLLLLGLLGYTAARVVPLRLGDVRARWLRAHASFGVQSFLSGTLSELNTRVDVMVLGFFRPEAVVGVYSLAAFVAEGLNQLPVVVRNNVDPLLGAGFAAGDLRTIERQCARIRRVFWPAMVALGVAAVGLYQWGLSLFFAGTEFGASWSVFAILVLGIVASAGYRPFLGILPQGGRPKHYTLVVALVALGNLVGDVALVPSMGMHGAALATAAMQVLEAAVIVIFARRLFGVAL